jgi:beta-galactosidase
VWREQFTPTTHLGYTENKREIVFRGEEGAVSTPPRLELIKADLKNSPRLGWDGAVYLEWYDTFKNFIQRKHLSDVFASVDSLTTALGAVSFYNQGRRIEDHRICNLNDGYAVNGWEAEILENHSGIVDCFRHPKADPRILAYYNQPLYVAVKIRNQILESPGTVTADFYLVNEKNLQGPHTLKIRVASPGVGGSDNAKTGGVSPLTPTLSPLATFRRQIAVNVAGGETFGQPLAEGIQIPVANASGQFRVEAVLLDSAGHQQARGHDEFLAVDWRQARIADNGAVYEWGNVVSEFLKKEKRCQVPAFDDHQTKLDWILVARAPYEQPQVISAENFVDAAARPAPLSTTFVADRDFSSPLHQRQDKMVDFRWPAGSTPDPAVGADSDYGVRFEGWVLPPRSGRYTFATRSTGAVRLWVDDRHLIDAWADRSRPENHGVIELQQGKPAKVRLDFFHHRAIAQIQLLWSPPASQTLDPERFFERVRRDGTTLILADYADAWMPLLQKHTTLRYSGTFDLGTAWLGGQYFVRDHPLFKDLPVNQAMNWQYQKLVQTGRNRYGLKVEGEDFVAGCYQSTPFQLGTAVGTVQCGDGRVIFSTLAVCSNLAAKDQPSAVARKLLCNYLEFAARAPR